MPIPNADAVALVSAIDRDELSIRRYQGLLGIRGRGPDGSFSARLVILFERPDRLRVELLGPFGSTRWSAVAKDGLMTVLFPGRDEYVQDANVVEVVRLLLGIPLSPADVMSLLSGAGLSAPERVNPSGARQGDLTHLRFAGGGRLAIDGDEATASPGQVTRGATSRYQVMYPTSWKKRRRQVPDRLRLEAGELEATLSSEGIDVNVPLDPEAFEIELPEDGVRLQPAEVGGEAVFVIARDPAR